MAPWIVLCIVSLLFTLLVWRGRSTEPPLPAGYEGERQLAELRAQPHRATNG
jgi:hypothetical protein